MSNITVGSSTESIYDFSDELDESTYSHNYFYKETLEEDLIVHDLQGQLNQHNQSEDQRYRLLFQPCD